MYDFCDIYRFELRGEEKADALMGRADRVMCYSVIVTRRAERFSNEERPFLST
jgi:hypothetical protein